MLPKRGDILKLDVAVEAQPVHSSYMGTALVNDGEAQTLMEGTLLRYLRTKKDIALVQVMNTPKVRKMVRQIHPGTKSVQSFIVDAYSVSFYCKKDEFSWEKEGQTL